MATQTVSISASVGTRNGVTPLPNRGADVATITDLFDRISSQNGGTSDVPGVWPTDSATLIAQVTSQIQTFQTTQTMATIDCAVDPHGATLRLMNQLAVEPRIAARVADPPGSYDQDYVSRAPFFAATESLPGTGPLVPRAVQRSIQLS
jgi:hypothetical protein